MKKSSKIRLLSFSAAFLLTLGGFLLDSRLSLHLQKTDLEYAYRRALNDLCDYVSGLHSTLEKAAYVNTPMLQNTVCAKLMEQSGGAKAAMAILPFSQERGGQISRFLAQVGDYALALSRKVSSGKQLSKEELQSFLTMEEYARRLNEALSEMQTELDEKEGEIGRTQSVLNNVDDLSSLPEFDDGLEETVREFTQFPSLLYDGPFSDHIARREALFLQDKSEVTREEAQKRAAAFLDCTPEELQDGGETGTALASFVFLCGEKRICVTKKGGEIAYCKSSLSPREENLSEQEAVKAARKLLEAAGISSLQESYTLKSEQRCTINFSYVTEDELQVMCYPDLIKVSIELEKGSLVEYDASGYLMNHHERQLQAPILDQEEAVQNKSPLLNDKSSRLALIPTPGLHEVLCWEYLCENEKGQEFLLYLNAQSGMEEQLYLMQETPGGKLAF